MADLYKPDNNNESERSEEFNDAVGLANDLQEKLKINSQVADDPVVEQEDATEQVDRDHKDEYEFKLTRSGTVPSDPLREPTPNENDWQQPLQANARKHSSANNTEQENPDQVFSLRPFKPELTGEPQITPTAIKTPVYHL
jgi:hypothetical protein